MKKVIFSLVVILTLASCNHRIVVMETSNGEIYNLVDGNSVSKVNDTLVVKSFLSPIANHKSIFGRYVGTLPKSFDYEYMYKGEKIKSHISFTKVVRIK